MSAQTRSTLIPGLRYRDAVAAIDWLCRAFGFQKKAVYMEPENTVAHAELTYGGGMVMLGSVAKGGEYGKLLVQPDEIGMRETQSPYLVVPDVDAAYATAKAAGATIVMEIEDKPYGRDFTCRDLEGHLWSVGSYDPWQEQQQ
jgi:uncharacterized glyoxalase superfamily protein PhnB